MVKSYDEDYLFIMYPNKEGEVVSEEYKTNVLTNDFGFRQKLLPDEIFDTLILGDSFTEGWVLMNQNHSFL